MAIALRPFETGETGETIEGVTFADPIRQYHKVALTDIALGVHLGCTDWNEIYSDRADNDPLNYYWRSIDLDVQPAFHGSK